MQSTRAATKGLNKLAAPLTLDDREAIEDSILRVLVTICTGPPVIFLLERAAT